MVGLDIAEDMVKTAYLKAVSDALIEKQKGKTPRKEEVVCRGNKPYAPKIHKIGRNELCPCGSGKKYKKCCLMKGE